MSNSNSTNTNADGNGNTNTGSNGTGRGPTGTLHQFERNRFFNGKLMTARDMETEQSYHAGRLATVTRHALGTGVVCGLDVGIEPAENPEHAATVVVSPGLAIDDCGRLIVVDEPYREGVPSDRFQGAGVSVQVAYRTCKTESVPTPGSEDACADECEYNRLRETFEVTFRSGPPDQGKPVPVDRVEFPARETLRFDETEGTDVAPTDDALQTPAVSYNLVDSDGDGDGGSTGEGGYRSCATPEDPQVFLAHLEERDGEVELAPRSGENGEPRSHVYTNDMLYAGLLDHAMDFENPHEVSLEVSNDDAGAAVRTTGGDPVSVTSSDDSLSITADADGRQIDIAGAGTDLGALAEYLREDALRCVACTFGDLQRQLTGTLFGADATPGEVAAMAREGLEAETPVYVEPDEFVQFVDELAETVDTLETSLPEFLGNLTDFEESLEELRSALDRDDPLEVALALDRLCSAADCLSGRCIEFDSLAENTQVVSPYTVEGVTLSVQLGDDPDEWGSLPRFTETEDGSVGLTTNRSIIIDVPRTTFVSVEVQNAVEATLTAYSVDEETLGSDDPTQQERQRGVAELSVESGSAAVANRGDIDQLVLQFGTGEEVLTGICVR